MQSPHRMGGRSSSRSIEGRSGQPIGGRSVANPVEERKRLCELVARDIIIERYLGKANWKSYTYGQHGLDPRRDGPAVLRRIKKLLPSHDSMRLAYRMQQSVAAAGMELETPNIVKEMSAHQQQQSTAAAAAFDAAHALVAPATAPESPAPSYGPPSSAAELEGLELLFHEEHPIWNELLALQVEPSGDTVILHCHRPLLLIRR